MRRLAWFAFVGAASVLGAFVACGSDVPDYPLLMDTCDAGWCPPPGTGASPTTHAATTGPAGSTSSSSSSTSASSTSSSASSSSGSVGTSELTGTIHRITSPDFEDTGAAFAGAATLAAYPAMGSEIDATYGGMSGTTFDLKSVPDGKAWFFVKDQSMGSAGVWSTVSALSLPQITSVALPVVDQALVTSIASTLPSVASKGVSPSLAHVVLLLQHGGLPYQGVQVSGDAGGAVIAYDMGPGTYSDTATATGSAGTVILFDTSLSGLATITIADPATMKSWPVSVLTGGGAFTIATVDLE